MLLYKFVSEYLKSKCIVILHVDTCVYTHNYYTLYIYLYIHINVFIYDYIQLYMEKCIGMRRHVLK